MATVSVTLETHLPDVLAKLETARGRALMDIGRIVHEDVVKNSPKQTGALQQSWELKVDEGEGSVTIGVPLTALPRDRETSNYQRDNYAKYVEVGTSKMTGRHMLRHAVTDNIDQFENVTRKDFKNA